MARYIEDCQGGETRSAKCTKGLGVSRKRKKGGQERKKGRQDKKEEKLALQRTNERGKEGGDEGGTQGKRGKEGGMRVENAYRRAQVFLQSRD